jgi:hypothetical protein
MAIDGVITAAGAVFELGNKIYESLQGPEPDIHSIQLEMLELQRHALSAQREFALVLEENRELTRQLNDNQALRDLKADLEYDTVGEFWIRKSERAKGLLIPFCPACLSLTDKLVHLIRSRANSYRCPILSYTPDFYSHNEGWLRGIDESSRAAEGNGAFCAVYARYLVFARRLAAFQAGSEILLAPIDTRQDVRWRSRMPQA